MNRIFTVVDFLQRLHSPLVLEMAEGREPGFLSPLEEQFIRESEADEDIDQQLLRERELAAHRLWVSFQDSATAVSHLFRGKYFSSIHI